MKSLVFSAKVAQIEFEYEYKDGTKATMLYRAPVTKEIEESLAESKSPKETLKSAKAVFAKRVIAEAKLVAKMLKELDEEGNVFEVAKALDEALVAEKNARSAS